MSAWIFVHST